MNSRGIGAYATSLILLLAGCGGDGGGSDSDSSNAPMFIQTCSLGCSSGTGGAQVSCALVSTYVNQDIAIYFSAPVNPASINSTSINVVDVNTGSVPPGLRLVDPLNPNKVIFRPTIQFDSVGNATFGFLENHTYRIVIPGTDQGDPGPYIQSAGGNTNKSRMQCEIQTTLGVVDLVPGAPLVDVRVDQAITATQNPNDTVPNIPAAGATDVWRNSTIRMSFNDVMNPATLAPGGSATFIKIQVDLDGDLATTGDRQTLFGTYVVQQDTANLTTSLVFTANNGIPSSGNPLLNPLGRKIVITLPTDLRDLAGNPLGNPQILAFTPEFVPLLPVILPDQDGEQFIDTTLLDAARSSAEWGGGKLTRGFGGGSGRCGELVILPGQVVTLNTDSQDFPLPSQAGHDVLDNLIPGVDYFPGMPVPGPEAPRPLTITDGVFEFSQLTIESGGLLVLTGSQPARLYSRGSINLQGVLDVSGQSPGQHASDLPDGQAGGLGGPNAGDGGKGATRRDSEEPAILNLPAGFNGINIDETSITINQDGETGGGVGGVGTLAAGAGGVHHPATFPSGLGFPNLGTIQYTLFALEDGVCRSAQVGSPGGGGAYATDGGSAMPDTLTFDDLSQQFISHPVADNGSSNLPPVTASGGLSSQLGIEPPGAPPVIRKLEAENGNLRGGAGGGGGGSSMWGTDTGDGGLTPCGATDMLSYRDHSACAGGGGGGALQLVSGRSLNISGLIDAGGGDGGTVPPFNELELTGRNRQGESGGGGAGGAVRVQAQQIDLSGTTQVRIDVAGGVGGVNGHFARGGSGGAGLIRLEASGETLVAANEAPHIGPQDALLVGPDAENILSVGTWNLPVSRPDCYTGATSCWMQPTGNFFQILFRDDDVGNPEPDLRYGWNMDIIYDSGSGPTLIKFRGPDPNLPFTPTVGTPDFQAFLGNTLNHGFADGTGSYLSVRFQGAQVVGNLQNPCNLSLDPSLGQILPNSLTPWVRHPAELNQFNPKPNIVRYTVVFDTSLSVVPASVPSFIQGVTNLKILCQPD
jgi:hypothetical protein